VIANVDEATLATAYLYAKPKWIKLWKQDKKEYEFIIDGIKESSLFFFIWTQYERAIRKAMVQCFNASEACHEVHDAVYSRENDVSVEEVEKYVLEQTGFVVKISID
jgi:hypothetical protein